MASLVERLRARASVSRTRVEDLRGQIAILEKELAEEELQLSRWAVAEDAVTELLAEEGDTDQGRAPADSEAPVPGESVAAAARERRVVSAPVTRTDGKVLREANEGVVLALASAGRPLRARPICEAVGWETGHRAVERMRVKLKSLVKQGWLTEDEVGLFAIAPGVGDTPDTGGPENDATDHAG
ncbi:hypothetical protein GCM10010329_39330 [Streptomyces spiroverticillatus]|uniref:Uncharacterized protein n=1 Tax=Streptomyces finlayi TaxID=67296 RepID=A0A919CA36_9ACTN|nr:hypothetical protein [Streptomyces finlayi]GHA12429.1 hypothetical protein GCM10010329_39330 [Streptomyces spiroverticillatus]GHC94379.1 hypothetical protein GCM10010334_32290 [Streptomyces finlayi]